MRLHNTRRVSAVRADGRNAGASLAVRRAPATIGSGSGLKAAMKKALFLDAAFVPKACWRSLAEEFAA
jgi:hypothetical protein